MPSLAACVITKNEERHLAACLATLSWADEVVVFDSLSTDRTAAIARSLGARLEQRAFDDFPRQRNAALACLGADWVLFVDADERVTTELAREVRLRVGSAQSERDAGSLDPAGFWVPRHNMVLGRCLTGGGWYPDHQLRLLRVDSARYDEARPVHEVVLLAGPAGFLANPLVHHNYEHLGQFRTKLGAYAALETRMLRQQGERARGRGVLGRPAREFWRRYVTLRAYRDGWQGLALCAAVSVYTGIAYYRLWREQNARGSCPTG
ncbi:MAG: glycosyltransferase family 2 protein [Chloroflexi bacterium]|nr:glycosyltransferase family 2 protein [Chloroflexota bacterium]MCL5107890.1 glycosyltransferase family 2 protein [Chloroflexota bacterium]